MTYKKWYWTWEDSINGTNFVSLDDCKKCFFESEAYMEESFTDYMNNCLGKNGALEELEDVLFHYVKEMDKALASMIETRGTEYYSGDLEWLEHAIDAYNSIVEKIKENAEE